MTTAADLKRELEELASKRSKIEEIVSDATARLEEVGVGMDVPMVDSEGYPRADVDITAIRADRQRVRMLSNDHKELTTQIEILLHRLHAISRDPGAAISAPSAAADGNGHFASTRPLADPIAVLAHSTRAFAEIDEVSEGSPAATAGLRVGDLMVRFGTVSGQTPNVLQAVAAALTAAEGQRVDAVVLRGGEELRIALTPQKWEGRGLLGCHLKPLR